MSGPEIRTVTVGKVIFLWDPATTLPFTFSVLMRHKNSGPVWAHEKWFSSKVGVSVAMIGVKSFYHFGVRMEVDRVVREGSFMYYAHYFACS
ncbi:hypothetical protein CEXT_262401 [Caerostris extrusa]|uniref:Uncharacterized protein n=1 Tax=Caerostris extrusa TaxID=172846 RepID=A0AAV4QJN0_CAEEX|nr:hypothetical protein CEXT_262401 [Caerostris extrusa]